MRFFLCLKATVTRNIITSLLCIVNHSGRAAHLSEIQMPVSTLAEQAPLGAWMQKLETNMPMLGFDS